MDQVTLLTQEIEDWFLVKKVAETVFVDLTVAYDTVWHRSLNRSKLFRLVPCNHFTLTAGTGPKIKLRRVTNDIP